MATVLITHDVFSYALVIIGICFLVFGATDFLTDLFGSTTSKSSNRGLGCWMFFLGGLFAVTGWLSFVIIGGVISLEKFFEWIGE